MRQCEDHMDVTRREKFSSTCGDPPFPRRLLALRTVPVAAGVAEGGGAKPGAGARVEDPAGFRRSAAANDPRPHCLLPPTQAAISLQSTSSPAPEGSGALQ